jgi:hypothetical protein
MKGGVKEYPSLALEAKRKVSTVYKPKMTKKFKVKHLKKFKTLKRKLEKVTNNSDVGQIKSYKLCLAFIDKFLKKYETIMNTKNSEKQSNYSLFASILAIALSKVNEEYDDIIDESELLNNNNTVNLIQNPDEYLEKYLEYVEDEDIIGDFEKVIEKYFNTTNRTNNYRMELNNSNNGNNIEQEYVDYSGFIRDSVSAVKETIREYSSELKTKKKIANNVNIDDLIMGLTAVKIKGAPNNTINAVLTNDFLNKFMKLGF